MAVTISNTNKPLIPRSNDLSEKKFNRASLYSGKALDFDGVNDQITGEAPTLPSSNYTICAHFRIDFFATGGMITWGDFATGERRSMLIWDGGHTGNYTLRSSTYGSNPEGSTYLEVGKWYFGCVSVASDGGAKIYLNGQLDGTGTNTLNAYTNTDYYIGRTRAASEFFNGALANTRVFNQVLTAAQVSDLYLNPEKIVPDGVANSALKLWLPMMEGAGTTAYDGSGNGNHGTISGATWVSGVGAPVAQTALVGWNKGVNVITHSESLSGWTQNNGATTENYATAPNGTTTADRFVVSSVALSEGINVSFTADGTSNYTISGFVAKSSTASKIAVKIRDYFGSGNHWCFIQFNPSDGTVTASAGTYSIESFNANWWYVTATSTTPPTAGTRQAIIRIDNEAIGVDFIAWGVNVAPSEYTIYTPTLATAQTSPVLLPQGLTANKDITGVNSVSRNAYALNLDGASWAEVHDNASVDLSNANASFEAWLYYDGTPDQYLFNKFSTSAGFRIRIEASNNFGFFISDGTNSQSDLGIHSLSINAWNHLVLTTDGTNFKRYINGSLVDTDIAPTPLTTYANAEVLYIGCDQFNANNVDNQLALPRIYNRALTATEVARNYNADKSKFGL